MTRQTKESIKTALAMTIAYWIALSMGWERPYWAGIAVSVISLSTAGQSLNKGVLRTFGTLLAFVASLTIIALFIQERWWFITALSAWIGFCTYNMCASKHSYVWLVAGFVSAIICFDAGASSTNAFYTAVLRTQETGLGILVYSLVSIYLWPASTANELDNATRELTAIQRKSYSSILDAMSGDGAGDGLRSLQMQAVQARNRSKQALTAALTDTYKVRELSGEWRQFQGQSADLMTALERWYSSLKEVEGLDLHRLLPNLDTLTDELEQRFARIEAMLAGDAPEWTPQAIELQLDKDAIRSLSHFNKAALTVTWTQLQHIEELTRSLFDMICSLKGFGPSVPEAVKTHIPGSGLLPDPDYFVAVAYVMASTWIAYLVWIYIEVPGGVGFVSLAATLAMVTAPTPQLRPLSLLPTVLGAVAFAGALYIFIMPQLSSFTGLGLMIFGVTFAICYLFAAPSQGLRRVVGLTVFVSTIGVSNQQSYSFLSIADTALMFLLILMLLSLTHYIPLSPRPEHVFLRLLRRFFRSCRYLEHPMTSMHPTLLDRWKKAFHTREISTLPGKLATWGKAIGANPLADASADQMQALTSHLQALTFRMQELLEVRDSPQAALLVRELRTDIRAWLLGMQKLFQDLSQGPTTASAAAISDEMAVALEHLETRIEETLNMARKGEISDLDGERFYRLLGAYRGVSEAAIQYAGFAEEINWSRWHETQF